MPRRNRWDDKEPPRLLPVAIAPCKMLRRYDHTERWPPLGLSPAGNPAKSRTRQPGAAEDIFIRPPIFELIFSSLSPVDLVRFARTCRLASNAISLFSERAYNINKHLLRFFSNPIGFRSLQAKTGTLISGSNALQFLDRAFYPESDLDIYTHPGHTREVGSWLIHQEGYTFMPDEEQEDFGSLDWSFESWNAWETTHPRTDIVWEDMHVQKYRISGLSDIYRFQKPSPSGGEPLQVQIMAAEHTPLQCILGFHSSTPRIPTLQFSSLTLLHLVACVMNFISFDAAYSLYPRATFGERRTLCFANLTQSDIRALAKYSLRGWTTLTNVWAHEITNSFHVDTNRWVTDSLSWVVPLDIDGLELRPRLSPVSQPFFWDPVRYNSWVLTKPTTVSKMFIAYHILKPTLFRYTYMFADIKVIHSMGDFFVEQGRLEHAKMADIPEDERADAWAW